MKRMYSRESFSNILQRILQFEEEVKALYDGCIKKLKDKNTIDILQSISKEEEDHIALTRELMELIKE